MTANSPEERLEKNKAHEFDLYVDALSDGKNNPDKEKVKAALAFLEGQKERFKEISEERRSKLRQGMEQAKVHGDLKDRLSNLQQSLEQKTLTPAASPNGPPPTPQPGEPEKPSWFKEKANEWTKIGLDAWKDMPAYQKVMTGAGLLGAAAFLGAMAMRGLGAVGEKMKSWWKWIVGGGVAVGSVLGLVAAGQAIERRKMAKLADPEKLPGGKNLLDRETTVTFDKKDYTVFVGKGGIVRAHEGKEKPKAWKLMPVSESLKNATFGIKEGAIAENNEVQLTIDVTLPAKDAAVIYAASKDPVEKAQALVIRATSGLYPTRTKEFKKTFTPAKSREFIEHLAKQGTAYSIKEGDFELMMKNIS